jgi:uncharacterized membrane protein YgcG
VQGFDLVVSSPLSRYAYLNDPPLLIITHVYTAVYLLPGNSPPSMLLLSLMSDPPFANHYIFHRALSTALLAFRDRSVDCPMVIHQSCRELGGIPENFPRSVRELQRDDNLNSLPRFDEVDFSLLPSDWPAQSKNGHGSGKSGGGGGKNGDGSGSGGGGGGKKKGGGSKRTSDPCAERVVGGGFLEWLREQPQTRVAVVCHHNYITSLLGGVRVENAVPIECVLDGGGIRLATPEELGTRRGEGGVDAAGGGKGQQEGGKGGRGPRGADTLGGKEVPGECITNAIVGKKKKQQQQQQQQQQVNGGSGPRTQLRVTLVDKPEQQKGGTVLLLPKSTGKAVPTSGAGDGGGGGDGGGSNGGGAGASGGSRRDADFLSAEEGERGASLVSPNPTARLIVDFALAKFRGLKGKLKKAPPPGLLVIRRQSDGLTQSCDALGRCCDCAVGADSFFGLLANDDVLFVGLAHAPPPDPRQAAASTLYSGALKAAEAGM